MDKDNAVVYISGLRKSFGTSDALRGVELTVHYGDFVTIFGANGAGKSTLMRILAGLMFASSGEVNVMGELLRDSGTNKIRSKIGVVTYQSCLYPSLTAYDNLKFFGRLFYLDDLPKKIEHVLKKVDLWDRRDSQVKTFSSGMKQRVAIARAIIHQPNLLLLDEPFTGLDPGAMRELMEILEQFKQEQKTVVLVTHRLREGFDLANRLVVIRQGRVAFNKEKSTMSWEEFNELYHSIGESRR